MLLFFTFSVATWATGTEKHHILHDVIKLATQVSFVITLKSSPLPRELLKDEHSMINCAAVLKVSDNLKRQGEGGAI